MFFSGTVSPGQSQTNGHKTVVVVAVVVVFNFLFKIYKG